MSGVSIRGERRQGQDVRETNIMASQALANIVKSSLGPQGLDKMLVDDIGEITISNDGATILKQLEVTNPAAKVLVELAQRQDAEVGDGTTSVVIIAAEFLKRSIDLINAKIHPTTVIAGYRMALNQAIEFIKANMLIKVDTLGDEGIINVAKTSMSSKLIGPESEFFAKMVVEAMKNIKSPENKFHVKNVHIVKVHGKSINESQLVNGFVIESPRIVQAMPLMVKNCKIACIDFNLNRTKMQLGVQILLDDPNQLEKIRQKEMDITRERCKRILEAGANVILSTKAIDDFAVKYFSEKGCIAVRRVKKDLLRKIALCSGATVIVSLYDNEGNEKFEESWLGKADFVHEEKVGDWEYVFVEGFQNVKAQTILIRGANEYLINEVERSLHDSLCVVKRVLESKTVVPGGGAVEAALCIFLEDYSKKVPTKEQLAIAEFAESLLVIPKTLVINSSKDAAEMVSRLLVFHASAQKEEKNKDYIWTGLDLLNGKFRNSIKSGVLEPAISKIKSLKFATEAAIAILRIDDSIQLERKQPSQEGREM